jgi:hypothetical protein
MILKCNNKINNASKTSEALSLEYFNLGREVNGE